MSNKASFTTKLAHADGSAQIAVTRRVWSEPSCWVRWEADFLGFAEPRLEGSGRAEPLESLEAAAVRLLAERIGYRGHGHQSHRPTAIAAGVPRPHLAWSLPDMRMASYKVNANCRVLVVDDNIDAADSLVSLLQSLGFDACATYEGREAVLLAELVQPHLVILDINMPGMDGFETAACIRGTEVGARSYLVALTGSPAELDPVLASCMGFDRFITKPVSTRKLAELAWSATR